MATEPQDELAKLRAELDEVREREARYRLVSVQDYLELQARLRAMSSTIGERGKYIHQLHLDQTARATEVQALLQAMNATLEERGTYIHQLHLDQIARRTELEAVTADLETLVWRLHRTERDLERARRRTPAGFLRSLFHRPADRSVAKVPPGDFIYHLSTSPFRVYHTPKFTLQGWAFPRDGRPATSIRVRVDDRDFPGRTGLPAPEAIAQHGPQANNPQPGFEVTFATPPGRHWLALEAQLDGGEWRSIVNLPIWCLSAG